MEGLIFFFGLLAMFPLGVGLMAWFMFFSEDDEYA